VRKEYRLALQLRKRIVPLILDTPARLPKELERFQWIDFSAEIMHTIGVHRSHEKKAEYLADVIFEGAWKRLDGELCRLTGISPGPT
jgi:hypothetical protein